MKATTTITPTKDAVESSPRDQAKHKAAPRIKIFTMSKNDQRTTSSSFSSSRRVSLDMGFASPQRPMHPHSGRSISYGPPISGFPNGYGGPPMDGPILPIPPVCGVPRNGVPPPCPPMMPLGRRQSAPGFYSRQDPIAPAMRSPHHPGMQYMPTQPGALHRRGSCAPNFPGQHAFGGLSPSSPMHPRSFMGSHLRPSSSGNTSNLPPSPASKDPFENIHPSDHVGLSAEIDATVDEVIASSSSARESADNEKPPTSGSNDKSKKKPPRIQTVVSFPVKLYEILMDPKYSEFIAWLPHGRAWRILKQKSFEKEVIPKHFRSARYASFMRQVNGWGFKRITEGPDLNAYYHESFLRGLPELVSEMRRPQKGDLPTRKLRGFPENPDFYKISSIAPLPAASMAIVLKDSLMSPEGAEDSATVSESSDELNVVSERSHRTKRTSWSQKTKNEETEAAAALFFGEVASVGSWMGANDEWERRDLSPVAGLSSKREDIHLNDSTPSLTSIPRELQIPSSGPPSLRQGGHPQPGGVLSKADLEYLAQQNRLLLKQSRVITGCVRQQA